MDFVALLSVFVMITVIEVVARPAIDSENDAIEDGLKTEDNSEELTFKFPTTMKNGFTMTINGTINCTESEIFTAILRAENNGSCRITHDFRNKQIEISSDNGSTQVEDYNSNYDGSEVIKFSLFIRARKRNEDNRFQITFEANNAGDSNIVNCYVKNIDDFGDIVFKEGVQNITSMLFEFNHL